MWWMSLALARCVELDGGHGCRQGFCPVALHQGRLKSHFGFPGFDNDNPHRAAVRRGRSHPGQIPGPPEQTILYRLVQPIIMGSGLEKKGIEGLRIQNRCSHFFRDLE